MNGDISWMHYTEINFLTRKKCTQTLESSNIFSDYGREV